jgi:AcrR family transcriptional regulator
MARATILEVARQRFGERGYRATTTAELAEAAGVAEKTLFRHFPTKAALFREAVVQPFAAFVAEYLAGWEARPAGLDVVDEVHDFYAGLLEELVAHRDIVLALEAVQAFGPPASDEFPELQDELDGLLAGLERILETETERRGYDVDVPVLTRMMFGLAMVVAFQAPWLFRAGDTPDRERLLQGLTNLVVYGVTGRR